MMTRSGSSTQKATCSNRIPAVCWRHARAAEIASDYIAWQQSQRRRVSAPAAPLRGRDSRPGSITCENPWTRVDDHRSIVYCRSLDCPTPPWASDACLVFLAVERLLTWTHLGVRMVRLYRRQRSASFQIGCLLDAVLTGLQIIKNN